MQEIIKRYNIKAKKSLGQNFLMEEKVLDEIVEITQITWENIIEVWPWFWALTTKILSKKPKSLKLVELDNSMVDILKDRLDRWELDITNIDFEIISDDILKYTPTQSNYKVIANIPYYITSPILFRFLYELKNKPKVMIILMQKEVWERIVSEKSSVLSLFVQKKCTTTKKIFVPKHFFSPAPKIDSSVLYFELKGDYDYIDDEKFLSFIKAAFSNPRKKMINNLSNFWYDKQTILEKMIWLWYDENTRAEAINIDDFIKLIWFL